MRSYSIKLKTPPRNSVLPRVSYKKLLINTILALVLIFTVFYLIELLWFAFVPPKKLTEDETQQRIEQIKEVVRTGEIKVDAQAGLLDFEKAGTVLFIPNLNLNLGVFAGDDTVLDKGIWDRYPDRTSSDNIVLTGHRFTIGSNIFGYQRKSPLMHIEELKKGDSIYLINKELVTEYKVTETFRVEPNENWIEKNNLEASLTLYSCTLAGANDGRYVVRAGLVK